METGNSSIINVEHDEGNYIPIAIPSKFIPFGENLLYEN